VAPDEPASPAYQLVHAGLDFQWQPGRIPIEWSVGAKNIFNTRYIDHLSRFKVLGIPAPGINFFLRAKFRFEFRCRASDKSLSSISCRAAAPQKTAPGLAWQTYSS